VSQEFITTRGIRSVNVATVRRQCYSKLEKHHRHVSLLTGPRELLPH